METWFLTYLPNTSVHSPKFQNKTLFPFFRLSSKRERNGTVFGPLPLREKEIHSTLSPVPCLGFISSSSLEITLTRTAHPDNFWEVSEWLALRNARGKEYHSYSRGNTLHPCLGLRLSSVWLSTLTFSATPSLFCFLICLSWPVSFLHQNSFISAAIRHRS